MADLNKQMMEMLRAQMLMGAGAGLLGASQGSPGRGRPGFGQMASGAAQGAMGPMQNYMQMMPLMMQMRQQQAEQQRRQQLMGQITQGMDPQQAAMARMFPEKFAEAMYRKPDMTKAMQNAQALGLQPGTQGYNEYMRRATLPKTSPRDRAFGRLTPEEQKQVLMKPPISIDMGPKLDYERRKKEQDLFIKKREEYPVQAATMQDLDAQQDLVLNKIDEVLPRIGTDTAGFIGNWAAAVPGTPAYNVKADLDVIRANLGLEALSAMRAQSTTGASGMGALSEGERKVLESKLASIDQAQSPTQLRKALRDLRNTMLGARGRRKQRFETIYKDFIPKKGQTPAPRTDLTGKSLGELSGMLGRAKSKAELDAIEAELDRRGL